MIRSRLSIVFFAARLRPGGLRREQEVHSNDFRGGRKNYFSAGRFFIRRGFQRLRSRVGR